MQPNVGILSVGPDSPCPRPQMRVFPPESILNAHYEPLWLTLGTLVRLGGGRRVRRGILGGIRGVFGCGRGHVADGCASLHWCASVRLAAVTPHPAPASPRRTYRSFAS